MQVRGEPVLTVILGVCIPIIQLEILVVINLGAVGSPSCHCKNNIIDTFKCGGWVQDCYDFAEI